jgi:DHA1 family bicyclomycin/chloramphenicol resistance-like MFS transporter
MPHAPAPAGAAHADIRFGEFVALIALLMALTALSIDIMLVALPDIAAAYAVPAPNDRQLVITAYLLGFAAGQPFHGPLSDSFGRKPLLIAGLIIFAVGAVLAVMAPTFGMLLAARALQGFGCAAPRVVAIAVVRDRHAGRQMSRVMSFVMMVFIIVPILAPTLGDVILRLGGWPWIFAFLFLAAAFALALTVLRLPETRPPPLRTPLSPAALAGAVGTILASRTTLGNTVALGFVFGGLMTYVGTAQQIFVDVYGLGGLFPAAFGALASVIALGSITNTRLVGRLGMHRVAHAALIGYVASFCLLGLVSLSGDPPFVLFAILMAAGFYCFSLMVPNLNAMSMEPMGRIAGMASSFIGLYTTAVSAALGWLIGQTFDGTLTPIAIGFAALSVLSLLAVLATERGRLMRSSETGATPTAGH